MPRRKSSKHLIPPWIESATEPVILLDAAGAVAMINDAGNQWLGVEPETPVGRVPHPGNLSAADETDRRLAGIAVDVSLHQTQRQTVFATGSDGTIDQRNAEIIPLQDEKSALAWTLIIVRPPASTAQHSTDRPGQDDMRPDQLRAEIARHLVHSRSSTPVHSVLGTSPLADALRGQLIAAESATSHLMICGPVGSERELMGTAIHASRYRNSRIPPPLTPVQCKFADQAFIQDVVRQSLSARKNFDPPVVCLLLVDADQLESGAQAELGGFLKINPDFFSLTATGGDSPGKITGAVSPALSSAFDPFLASRLTAQTIVLPALRHRRADLGRMVTAIVDAECRVAQREKMRISSAALEMLAEYHWPGDMAELRTVLASMIAGCHAAELETTQIPQPVRMAVMAQRGSRLPVEKIKLDDFLGDVERELIQRALAQTRFNRASAARLLGVNRARLLRRCDVLGIALPTEQPEFEPIDFEETTE